MTQNNSHDRDEQRLADLLQAVDADAPPPDRERLAALREQSAEAFGEPEGVSPRTFSNLSGMALATGAAANIAATETPAASTVPLGNTCELDLKRSTPMMTLALRGFAALVASAAILIVGLLMPQPQPVIAGAIPFSEVLAELRGAETLQFRLVKSSGNAAEIWVRAPGLVRKEESPQRYEIAAGSRLWRVNEETNTVTEGDSPWFLSPNKQIDLVGLLDVDVRDSTKLLQAKPISRQPTDHGDEFVYLAALPTKLGSVTVEAVADAATKRLTRMTVWQGDVNFKQWKLHRDNDAFIDRTPPLADMQLVAMNLPVADDKFVVAKSLTEDGRIGKVGDAQGIVVLRPMLAKRWTPVCRDMLLKPGDWLRTELRGANAVKVTLSSEVELTLGPGTLIECMSPTKARLHTGQVQVRNPVAPRQELGTEKGVDSSKDLPVTKPVRTDGISVAERQSYILLAPREGSRTFKAGEKQLVRVDRDEKLVDVKKTPLWLAGFEGTTNNESLGSLIVNLPDGRNEPLTVGYHKVSVEIRDQIARTTIEESFVNHTVSRLEGVFHFPLPQDASISGFGMWIGNDLIEADVVEKQRAREIYETILREKRDPGLLEWAGGNIFKARVFPIEGNSEKRIKIVYTQVLPLRANRYRYSYGLRSELLRTKPLRELSLNVTVNSALPLKSVTCPTHAARVATSNSQPGEPEGGIPRTESPQRPGANALRLAFHSAQVDFAAQEYTPTRDFEVVCEIDGRQSDVVVVPHRRGDDGYLLVQVSQPAPEGNWQREVLPEGKPLNLVLLCDTSASMDSEKRMQQTEFVATVLSSLGEADRFLLAASDVGTVWAFAEPVAASAENVTKARAFLDDRLSLGWTNLDRAFEDVLKKAPANSHIIYIGDGIVSSGDTDPAAFVKRLAQRSPVAPRQGFQTSPRDDRTADPRPTKASSTDGIPVAERQGYVHAIGVGNSFESVVLKGIASVGGGSVRNIGGEQTPQVVATELLNEITQPGLRDLNVEFRGLRVAAVYPERLPNVAAGTQQILVGRYLPDGKDQVGEIIVTGMRGNEKVKYAARVNFKDAEEGNSFIPRLWARAHLDQLLAQGQNAAIRDDIIRLSEEFHIITPLTSLLVLETDADRERFGVQRRYEMRDGERFFAEGRDNANYELLQQQMKRAGDWRLGLRRQVLRELAGLGRNPQAFQQQVQSYDHASRSAGHRLSDFGVLNDSIGLQASMSMPMSGSGAWGFDGNGIDAFAGRFGNRDEMSRLGRAGGMGGDFNGPLGELDSKSLGFLGDLSQKDSVEFDADMPMQLRELGKSLEDSVEQLSLSVSDRSDVSDSRNFRNIDLQMLGAKPSEPFSDFGRSEPLFAGARGPAASEKAEAFYFDNSPSHRGASLAAAYGGGGGRFNGRGYYQQQPDYTSWINTLFPALAAVPGKAMPPKLDLDAWSPEAIALSKSLLRVDSLLKLDGGIELKHVTDQLDPRWMRRASRSSGLALYSPSAWLTRPLNPTTQTVIEFCDTKERGVFSLAFGQGRVRASVEQELKAPPLPLNDLSLYALHESYASHAARVEAVGENRAKLIVTTKDKKLIAEFVIDTVKHVVLRVEWFNDGKVSSATTFDDFVEVASSWWAKKSAMTDAKGRTISETTFDVRSLANEPFAERIAAELVARPKVQFVRLPFVKLKVARQKVADGSAGFEDRLAMILHNAQLQQWDEMWKHVDAAEKLAMADKPGVRWLRTVLFGVIRRNEEARQRLLIEAKQLAAKPQQDEYFLAQFILGHAYSLMGWPEYFEFVQLFEATIANQPAGASPRFDDGETLDGKTVEDKPGASVRRLMLQEARLQCLDALGRHEEALALRKVLVEQSPWHLHWQTDYASRLGRAGQVDAGIAWLKKEIERPIERETHEDETLRSAICDVFRTQARWTDLLKFTGEWIARKPDSQSYNSAYAQHLSALVFNDQLDAANALAEQWLKEARIDGPLAPDQRARLETAIQFANGQSYQLSFQRPDDRWFEPVADTIRFFLRHKHHSDIATRGIGNHYFLQSDVADRLRGEFLALLQTDLANLTPTQINALLGWTLSGRMELKEPLNGRKQLDASEVPNDVWRPIAVALKPRWLDAKDKIEKNLLSESLRTIYATRFADTDLLPFLREQLVVAHADYRVGYVSSLFEALLTTKWSDEIEKEAFGLLLELSDAKEAAGQLAVQLPSLHRLVDAMLANRQSLAESQLGDQGEQNKLTRKELAAKKAEFRKTARVAVAARLAAVVRTPTSERAADRQDVGVRSTTSLAAWMRIEKAWLDVQLDQNLVQVEELCWQILGEAPPKQADDSDDEAPQTEPQAKQHFFDALLKQRAFTMVMNLAARRKAEPATIARVLKYIDAGIRSPVAPRLGFKTPDNVDPAKNAEGNADADSALGIGVAERHDYVWRNAKFRMLIALDRADDLDRELREWIRTDVSTAPWRQSLARLVAERGKLDEAIQLFEACEKDKLLSASDYRMLADWYLVSNRRAAYERSRIEAFKQMPEHQLSNSLYQVRNRWYQQNVPLPSELDENTLFTFRALFEKSASPENYFWQLREIYAASRDFRLLQMIPDAVLGRSPQQVYSFLLNLQSQVLYELRNEATADEILARVKQLRASRAALAPGLDAPNENGRGADAAPLAKTLTTTDLRALDLLDALVERKSSELLNQPGPHVEACVAALKRAFDREWGVGEPVMMANFLHQLGTLPHETLKAEQLRELRELQKRAPANSRDHLRITLDYTELQFWNYSQKDAALREIEAEVTAYSQTNGGAWPHLDNELLGRFVSMREGANQHAAGETLLKSFLAKPVNDEQRKWLSDRLMSLFNHALEHDGAVSLGTGRAKLFGPLVALNLKELAAAPDENVRYNLVARIATTFDIAHRHKLPGTADVVRAFAFETMPALLKRQQAQYRNTVTAPMHIIGEVLGPKGALQYIVERIEQYPQRLELAWENSWNAFGYELARRRAESANAKLDIKELEPRVLKLVILELQRDIRTGEARNQYLYQRNYQYFWTEKADDFAKAAEEVLAERKTSGRRAMSVASYLWSGLDRGQRAIEILFVAHKNGLLDEAAQVQLVNWLHQQNRWAESIPLLEPLVASRPDNIDYRTLLMVAYHHSQRPEQLADFVRQTDAHFHTGGRWSEGNISQFARGCLSCSLHEKAVGYFNEAIALHQRNNPGSGAGDGMLSDLYQHLASAQSALGHTKEAVDAASAAIVSWGRHHNQRGNAIGALQQVLRDAKDLDEYVKHLDAESTKTGQDSPILRKAIGQTYQAKNEHAKAIAQLQLAIELQPHDKEVHQALIACYDATKNNEAATKQLLKLIDLQRHDLTLYQQLAERLKDNEAEAERAATSIIESAPNESESHTAMAELRQKQNRWGEAIPHWERVAELRRLEPTGLLKLTEAQLHEKQWAAARNSIAKLQKTEWPSRFNDVANQTRQLQERLPK